MKLEPIAIIGIGCRFPGGVHNPSSFWNLLRSGVDAITEVPGSRWDAEKFYHPDPTTPNKMNTRWGGFLEAVDSFEPQFFGIAPREAVTMDPQQRLLLEVTWEALEDAGQIPEQLRGSQTGVFIGIGTHDYSIRLWQHPVNDPYATTGTGNCIAANRISYVFDFKGPSLAVDTACSSSLVAVHLACQSLWCGESSLALAGGVNVLLLPTVTAGFSKGGFMSGTGRCKSFDASADGYVRSEGAGLVILKPLSAAVAAGDPIYAVIRGSAVNQDGFSNGMAAPNPKAQAAVLREAYRRAGIAPGQVQYVEAHGTGTKLGDPIELAALGEVLAEGRQQDCAIGSVKTNIGHTETAAGVAGLIKVALALRHQQIPPSLHFQTPNPEIPFAQLGLQVQTELAAWTVQKGKRIAGVNSFGFGGTNAHVVVEEKPKDKQKSKTQKLKNQSSLRPRHLLTLSAKTKGALRQMVEQYEQFLAGHPALDLADLCFTANTKRSHFSQRLAIVAESMPQLQASLRNFGQGDDPALIQAAGEHAPQIVFLFTGQGSQYLGMGHELYQSCPGFRAALDRCDQLLQPELGCSILELIWNAEADPAASERLDQTAYTQPALFALEYALAQLWMSWGVLPSALVGHSIGEYVAACIAGVFSLEDALKLVATRGRLMQALPLTGTMAAVMADEATVAAAIDPSDQIAIAAVNAPQNVVVSGEKTAVATLSATLEQQGIKVTPLTVSHAFHSPLMEPMLPAFAAFAAKVTYHPPRYPLVSNVTGKLVGSEIQTPDYWCSHVRQTVRFADSLTTLDQQGDKIFLELGAKPTLCGMGRSYLPQHLWLPSLRPGQSDWQPLLHSLAQLYVHGVKIDWLAFEPSESRQFVHLPTYPFQRQRFWWEPDPPAQVPVDRVAGHPLLGQLLQLAGHPEVYFQTQFEPRTLAYLSDHQVLNQPVFPAAGYVEMALAAVNQRNLGPGQIEQLRIEQPLMLHETPTVQVKLTVENGLRHKIEIFSLQQAEPKQELNWVRHATGWASAPNSETRRSKFDLDKIKAELTPGQSPDTYYRFLQTQGLNYGPCFQGIQQIWCGNGRALGQIQLPTGRDLDQNAYLLHPVLLDASFQLLGAAAATNSQQTFLPVGIDRCQSFLPAQSRCPAQIWSLVELQEPNLSADSSPDLLRANLWLMDNDGQVIAEVGGLCLQAVSAAALQRLFKADEMTHHLYQIDWQPRTHSQASPAEARSNQQSHWLILTAPAEQNRLAATLANLLHQQRQTCTVVPFETTTDLDAVLDCNPLQQVVYLGGLDPAADDGDAWMQSQQKICGSGLRLVQGLLQRQGCSRLWFVTQGAQPVGSEPIQVQQASLWGLGRVIQREHPALNCTCVDLEAAELDAGSLLHELLHADQEDQIVYRQGQRYVARLIRQPSPIDAIPNSEAFQLRISDYGVLDHLSLVPVERRPPAAGAVEIRVHAAGINFRDVLNALGLLKPFLEQMGFSKAADILFGWECAGTVSAVGAGVAEFQVGDAVIAVAAKGSLGAFVTVASDFVVAKPESLSFVEAATIPTTFLTAAYGLRHLAKLQAGERVLIHAAAGGVGLAAVQLSQLAGAEVFATASPGKWSFLQSIGVTQVMNSRTLDFATELQAQAPDGMDVILNSLNGEFIDKNLTVLAQNGRLVEIGKIGIWDQKQVQQVRPDVSYFPFDLLEIAEQQPTLIKAMLQELMQLFAQGKLKPLPYKAFAIADAVDAFRYMAQAKQIGKVVLTLPSYLPQQPLIQPQASYLITGGTGGLGLVVARWLAAQGATHLCLASRSAPSATAQTAIQQLRQMGVTVDVVQADVACLEEIKPLFQSAALPLRGIIHAAGLLDDGLLPQQTWERFEAVMAAKVQGAWNLHCLSRGLPLDFFVCFSSIATVIGSVGQGNYAAANAVLDALVQYRHQIGLPGLSVNWGAWAEVGMAARMGAADKQRLSQSGISLIDPAQGMQALEWLLQHNLTQASVLPIDWSTFRAQAGRVPPLLEQVVPVAPAVKPALQSALLQQLATTGAHNRLTLLQQQIQAKLAKVLGFSTADAIDLHENFAELGMDSLMAVEFRNQLEAMLGCAIPQTLTFDYPTVAALADYLLHNHGVEVEAVAVDASGEEMQSVAPDQPIEPPQAFPQVWIEPSPQPAEPRPELEVLPEYYRFDLSPEYLGLQADLARVEQLGNPFFQIHEGTARDTTRINGRELISYASYNYLGMSGDPFVVEAVKAAVDQYGTSVSASRVVAGERPIHRQLEREIAQFIGTEDCIVYVGGHAANVTTIGHLFGKKDLILLDTLSHNSVRQGCELSQAAMIEFPHSDYQTLEQLLQEHRRYYQKVLIAIEGVYSTDGDLSPLPEIVALKQRYKTLLLVDEAHSIGVLGKTGRGISEHFNIAATEVDLWMGTLSKSFASCGGYIAGSKAIVEYLKYTAPGFVYSVGMSPANTAAALASLQLLQRQPERVTKLHERAALFLDLSKQQKFNTGDSAQSPVIPIIVGEPYKAVQLTHALAARGISVQPMVYPSVPYNAARLRFFITCLHTEAQIRDTVAAIRAGLNDLS